MDWYFWGNCSGAKAGKHLIKGKLVTLRGIFWGGTKWVISTEVMKDVEGHVLHRTPKGNIRTADEGIVITQMPVLPAEVGAG